MIPLFQLTPAVAARIYRGHHYRLSWPRLTPGEFFERVLAALRKICSL
jgi:hypothetical protein